MRPCHSRSRVATFFSSLTVTLSLAAGLLVATASPALACDCGAGLVPPAEFDTALISERAILRVVDGIQETELLLTLTGTADNAALIIPTPTPATVSAGSLDRFDELERQMLPRPRYVEDWWGVEAISAAVTKKTSVIPVVVNRVELGPLEAVTLAARNARGLATWLGANGYEVPQGSAAILKPYVAAGWSFVVLKLSTAGVLDGTIDPIRLTFKTDAMVFPTRLLQGSNTEQSVRLYVLGEHRAELVRAGTKSSRLNAAEKLVWAGRLPISEPHGGAFMTVFDVRYDNPEFQATADIGVVSAESDAEVVSTVNVVRTKSLLGIPFGTVLVGTGAIALLMLVSVFALRMRVR